jgi:hypothetical protein
MDVQAGKIKDLVKGSLADFVVLWFRETRVLVDRRMFARMLAPIPSGVTVHVSVEDAFVIREMVKYGRDRMIPEGQALSFFYQTQGCKTMFRVVHEAGWHTWAHRRTPTAEALDLNQLQGAA